MRTRLLLIDGVLGLWGVGCGRVAARLTYGAQATDLAPGDMMTVGCSPARGGAAAQSLWAVRCAGALVTPGGGGFVPAKTQFGVWLCQTKQWPTMYIPFFSPNST